MCRFYHLTAKYTDIKVKGNNVKRTHTHARNGADSVQTCIPDGHLHRVTYNRYRIDKIESPDDEQLNARNM